MESFSNSQYLNIAALCPSTKVLGPGKRFVIWVQGCCFSCNNCGSPEWRVMKSATLLYPEELAQRILAEPGLDGITISGGEPMLQAESLLRLVQILRTSRREFSVLCYTGFTHDVLREKNDPYVNGFLAEIDVLVDGPYIDELNDNMGWRGSANQRIHFLSGRHQEQAEEFTSRRRDIELFLFQEKYLVVGIPAKGFNKKLI